MKTLQSIADIPSEQYFELQGLFRRSLLRHYSRCGHDASTLIQHAVDGSIKLFDALALRSILIQTKPAKILEVGSFLGFSTRWILEATADWKPSVTSLDPRVRHRIFNQLREHVEDFSKPHLDRLRCVDAYFSSSNEEMFLHDYLNYTPTLPREEALQLLRSIETVTSPFDSFDFAFIDGDHSYQATVDNVSLAASMMPKGGTIVVHDAISWPEVQPALKDLSESTSLTLIGVAGLQIHEWSRTHHWLQAVDPGRPAYASILCDGLGIMQVSG
jgi:predicted O-methyltransferase YrrM